MPDPWHGINDPGYFKPQPAPADNTRVAEKPAPVPDPKEDPPPIEVRLSEAKFQQPDGGLSFNDKCKVQVNVEYLHETSLKKITFSLFCNYNGTTEEMKPDKEGFEKDGIAEAEFQLFYPDDYQDGDKADFFFKVSHRRGEKVIQSEKLTLPYETQKKNLRFPLDEKYNDHGYKNGERAFGSSRKKGKRAHAGCDLYAPVGEKIYAVADGVITRYRNFYGQTYAVEVNHGDFIVRYGEVQPPLENEYEIDGPPDDVCNGLPSNLKETSKVTRGQLIAFVGQLRLDKDNNGKLHNYPRQMLHFELYKGDGQGALTNPSNVNYKNVPQRNYERRSDLLDPTSPLEQAKGE
jgi:murein DD-endopeptidase MepM/ murein hydrolase activator NlpD